jgi:hypothetical protein
MRYDSLKHLDDIGLLKFSGTNDRYALDEMPKQFPVSYFGTRLEIHFENEEQSQFFVGNVLLSKIGQELAPICGAQPVEGFVEYLLVIWERQGFIASSPFPRTNNK